MACPLFVPTERADDLAFPHPPRLPLGASWRGACSAPGHEQTALGNIELESCNLGYAKKCSRLPKERSCDAVRFAVAKDSTEAISLQFVLETEYLPTAHGILQFDRSSGDWTVKHSDDRIQKMAQCFLQSYIERNRGF